jgi:hypothetical protein
MLGCVEVSVGNNSFKRVLRSQTLKPMLLLHFAHLHVHSSTLLIYYLHLILLLYISLDVYFDFMHIGRFSFLHLLGGSSRLRCNYCILLQILIANIYQILEGDAFLHCVAVFVQLLWRGLLKARKRFPRILRGRDRPYNS